MEGAGDSGDRSDRLRPRLVDYPTTLCRLGQCSRFYRGLLKEVMTSEPIKSDIQEEVQKRLDNLAWIEAIIGGTLIVTPKNNFIIKIIYYQNLKKQWD